MVDEHKPPVPYLSLPCIHLFPGTCSPWSIIFPPFYHNRYGYANHVWGFRTVWRRDRHSFDTVWSSDQHNQTAELVMSVSLLDLTVKVFPFNVTLVYDADLLFCLTFFLVSFSTSRTGTTDRKFPDFTRMSCISKSLQFTQNMSADRHFCILGTDKYLVCLYHV